MEGTQPAPGTVPFLQNFPLSLLTHAACAVTPQAAYLCLTQLLDYKHELVLLLVNTLLSDLKNDNFVVIATALVVTSKLIGADLINAGRVQGC